MDFSRKKRFFSVFPKRSSQFFLKKYDNSDQAEHLRFQICFDFLDSVLCFFRAIFFFAETVEKLIFGHCFLGCDGREGGKITQLRAETSFCRPVPQSLDPDASDLCAVFTGAEQELCFCCKQNTSTMTDYRISRNAFYAAALCLFAGL
jgi:hypothetical protein